MKVQWGTTAAVLTLLAAGCARTNPEPMRTADLPMAGGLTVQISIEPGPASERMLQLRDALRAHAAQGAVGVTPAVERLGGFAIVAQPSEAMAHRDSVLLASAWQATGGGAVTEGDVEALADALEATGPLLLDLLDRAQIFDRIESRHYESEAAFQAMPLERADYALALTHGRALILRRRGRSDLVVAMPSLQGDNPLQPEALTDAILAGASQLGGAVIARAE
jgi:hypothetical protein